MHFKLFATMLGGLHVLEEHVPAIVVVILIYTYIL